PVPSAGRHISFAALTNCAQRALRLERYRRLKQSGIQDLGMRFVIEYLRESTEEDSVCRTITLDISCLKDAGDIAFHQAFFAEHQCGAKRCQIRNGAGQIVALETIQVAPRT